MSREIKFKYIWSNPTNTHFLSKIFTLDEIESGEQFMVLENEPLLKNYRRVAILQWTGLLDKNGKEICEGDIVFSESNQYYKQDEIVWDCFAMGWDIGKKDSWKLRSPMSSKTEIIGNIYENKELITEVKNG